MHMYIYTLPSKPQVPHRRSDPRLAEAAVGGWIVRYNLIKKIWTSGDFGIFRGPESNLLIISRDNCAYRMLLLLSHFSHVWLFTTLWTVACRDPPSMGLSRQEYWSELPGPPPGDLPNPGIQPASLKSPALAGGFFTTIATWEAPQVDLLRSTQCTVVGAATAGSVISTEVCKGLYCECP